MSNVKQKSNAYSGPDAPQIPIDLTDYESLIEIMDTYNHLDYMLFGEDAEGQSVTISIWPDYIVVDTLQKNGWTRRNVYWRDGDTEELFSKSGIFE